MVGPKALFIYPTLVIVVADNNDGTSVDNDDDGVCVDGSDDSSRNSDGCKELLVVVTAIRVVMTMLMRWQLW